MASLASSAVTVVRSWTEGSPTGKRSLVKQLSIVLTGQGDATDKILATALGFTSRVESCSNLYDSANSKLYPAAPSSDGSYVVLIDPTQATDANRATIATKTGITVLGTFRGF